MHQLWAIIDKKSADILGMVMTIKHRTEVERIVTEALENPRHPLRKFPQDFELRFLATLTFNHDEAGNVAVTITDEHDSISIADLAAQTNIRHHAAIEQAQQEEETHKAFERWLQDQQQPKREPSILNRILGRK